MSQPTSDSGRWLERHRSYLTLLARAHLSSCAAAQLDSSDIVQQTLLDAFAKYRGSTDGELAAWLQRILKNNLIDALRAQRRDKRDRRREQSLEAAIDDSFSRTNGWLASVPSSPSQRLVRHEDLLRLTEALAQLPEVQREVIVRHHLQGWKLAEVAAEIGRSEAAVAGLLFRGLRTLQELLGE